MKSVSIQIKNNKLSISFMGDKLTRAEILYITEELIKESGFKYNEISNSCAEGIAILNEKYS